MLYEGVFRKRYIGIIHSNRQRTALSTQYCQLLEHRWMIVMNAWTPEHPMQQRRSSLVQVNICELSVLYALAENQGLVKGEFCILYLLTF
jgi:hypothetical protein